MAPPLFCTLLRVRPLRFCGGFPRGKREEVIKRKQIFCALLRVQALQIDFYGKEYYNTRKE